MENFSYHVPFYVVTGGIDLAGHSSELTNGQVGLFSRNTWSVATNATTDKEFFFAQGTLGGFAWGGQPLSQISHKSPFFRAEQVTNIRLSLPQRIQNEEWVLGFNGSVNSKSLRFETGKPLRIKILFTGQVAYRFFGGPKEYVVSYTPTEGCDVPCDGTDCPEPIADCLVHTQAIINLINEHVELSKYGVVAKLVNAPFTAGTVNMEKYKVCVCDNGGALELAAVQSQYPDLSITRVSREGAISCYEFCQPIAGAAPANFAQSGSILQAVCATCPAGSTAIPATDVYTINRVIAAGTDLTTDAARDTFADTVGTAYGVAGDTEKTFLGVNGAVASVKVKAAQGATLNPIGSDTVEFTHTEEAQCSFPAPASIAWVASGGGISSSRTLMIKSLQRPDCDANGDRMADLQSILAGVQGIQLGTLTKVAGIACADDYTVQQNSIDCLPEDCLTNNVTFSYDTLPSLDNSAWEVVPPIVTENAARKCGIVISAGYLDPRNGSCSFSIRDYYETQPVTFELSLLEEDGSACDALNWPTIHQRQEGRSSRQSGEYVVREVIMKTEAYQKHMNQYSHDPLERERFDRNLLEMVDRNAFYNLYYVSFPASYGAYTWRGPEQEKFTAVFAFKEGDVSAKTFEEKVLSVLEGKSGVSMHIDN